MFTIYDADWLIDHFGKNKVTRSFSKKMSRLRALYSIKIDLERCEQALDAITKRSVARAMGHAFISEDDALRDAAEATYAISLYARSTDVSSVRGNFDPRRFFSKGHRVWHENIISLRNQAIAHFGSGRHPAGPWADDKLTLKISTNSDDVIWDREWSRVNYLGQVISQFAYILPITLAGLEKEIAKATASLTQEIVQHRETLNRVLASCPQRQSKASTTHTNDTMLHVLDAESGDTVSLRTL